MMKKTPLNGSIQAMSSRVLQGSRVTPVLLAASVIFNISLALCMKTRSPETVYVTRTVQAAAEPVAAAAPHNEAVYGGRNHETELRTEPEADHSVPVHKARREPAVKAFREHAAARPSAQRIISSAPVKRSALESRHLPSVLAQLVSESSTGEEAMAHASRLAALDNPVHTRALAAILDESRDPLLVKAAATAIANIGNREALDVLVVMAEEAGENVGVYRDALASVSSPFGQGTLFEIARYHDDPQMRASASTALGNYRSSDVKRKLKQVFYAETDTMVRDVIDSSLQVLEQVTDRTYQPDPNALELFEMSDDIS